MHRSLSLLAVLVCLIGCSDDPAAAAGDGGPCAAKPGALRGRSLQTVMVGSQTRSFIRYAPEALDPKTPAPVVIVPHGYMMNADMMYRVTRYADLADRENIVVLFPNGQPASNLFAGPWNVGSPDCVSSLGLLPNARGDDDSFLDAMLDLVEADQCLDRDHIFMAGFSMGGYFSNHIGCTRADIRAVAPHSGGVHELTMCKSESKPVLIMHFQEDSLIPSRCGLQARDRWLELNKCQAEAPELQQVNGGSCEYYTGCQPDGQVGLCLFATPDTSDSQTFRGHGWSGGSTQAASFAIPETESATELSWSFFKKYAW